MPAFTKETLDHLKALSRIECSAEEEKDVLSSLQRVLSYMEQLETFSSETPPSLETFEKNRMRPDFVQPTLPRETFLANAPDQVGGMIRIPPAIKEL